MSFARTPTPQAPLDTAVVILDKDVVEQIRLLGNHNNIKLIVKDGNYVCQSRKLLILTISY